MEKVNVSDSPVTQRQCSVERIIQAYEVTEGAGVTVHRSIGTPALRNLDPFLMLDQIGSDQPDEYIAGFPDHPHRGFNTFTYMLDGHMLHEDSMGNRGDLRSGGAQWMKAASGVIHSEMPQQREGLMRGFQLWINLPAKEKMASPGYQEYSPEAVPVFADEYRRVKVLLGEYQGVRGPINDPITQVEYYDVTLAAGKRFTHSLKPTHNSFIYVFENSIEVDGESVSAHHLAVLSNGESLAVLAGEADARFLLVSGKPIGEPIVQYGPFVMNSEAEIRLAMQDYQTGRLVREKARMEGA